MHPTDFVLNDYVDGALAADGRAGVDEHLRGCEVCRALVTDLAEIRRAIERLRPMDPPARVWAAIETGLRESGAGRTDPAAAPRGTKGVQAWGWLAAAAAVVLMTVAGLRYGLQPGQAPAAGGSGTAPTTQAVAAELQLAEEHYQNAISGLEQIAKTDQGALDAQTAATLQKNLAVVDQAISESRAALRTQPDSEPAQDSLLASFKAKLALLQDTVALINEMRKGNDSGAARIVSELKGGR